MYLFREHSDIIWCPWNKEVRCVSFRLEWKSDFIIVAVNSAWLNIELIYCNLKVQDPTEKHFGDVGILDKYEDNNNNNLC
jgi:hypothetical protein